MIGNMTCKLCRLQLESPSALISSRNNMGDLWHRRMDHLHHGALNMLKEIVTNLPELSTEHSDVYKGCALGKYAKTTFPRIDSRLKGIFDLVHSYVCKIMYLASLTRCAYFFTFIDDFSNKT
jgi:hypothetical protein